MTDHALSFMHDHAAIAAEASLDGFYVLRSSVPAAPWCLVARGSSYSFWARYAEKLPPGYTMISQNRQRDIDRKAAENDYRINVKAEIEIERLHEKIDQLREREVLKLTEAVRMLTELLEQSASGPREPNAEGGRPS
jgi:Protein of unknown function (DUF1003)